MSRIWYFSAAVFLAVMAGIFYWMTRTLQVAPQPPRRVPPPAISAHPGAQPADPFQADRTKPDVRLQPGVWVSQAGDGARLVLHLLPDRQYALSVSIPTGGESEFTTSSQGTYIVQGETVKFIAKAEQGIFPQLGETRIVRHARDTYARDTIVLETRARRAYFFTRSG